MPYAFIENKQNKKNINFTMQRISHDLFALKLWPLHPALEYRIKLLITRLNLLIRLEKCYPKMLPNVCFFFHKKLPRPGQFIFAKIETRTSEMAKTLKVVCSHSFSHFLLFFAIFFFISTSYFHLPFAMCDMSFTISFYFFHI